MEHDVIREAYRQFNERNVEAALALMCEDVNWENALVGDRIRGRTELRKVWALMWASMNVAVEAVRLYEEDGRTVVVTRHVAREPGGFLISEAEMEEVYTFRDGLIARMDFREIQTADGPKH